MKHFPYIRPASITVLVLFLSIAAFSQTTEFTYQGSLKDGAAAANGNYDFEFRIYDALADGAQVGSVIARPSVAVTGGIFGVKLDFGSSFPGADRYLEVRVRNTGGTGYTILDPRQRVGSAPYAVKSLLSENAANAANAANATNAATATNATQLGGVPANQFVQTADPRLSDARNPLAGSANYIQNMTSQQASTNFNISGSGTAGGNITANIVRANLQFNLGANSFLSSTGVSPEPFSNTFGGIDSGQSTVPGFQTGEKNSFFGNKAGRVNSTGKDNSYFGFSTGAVSTNGNGNAFFGTHTGSKNTTGSINAFFGAYSGFENTSGTANTFLGYFAGNINTSGSSNTFVGNSAGNTNTTGSNNTVIGNGADVNSAALSHATAIGADSVVAASNTIALGRSDGTDRVVVYGLGSAGTTALCRNVSNQIATCSSSLRYKANLKPFTPGFDLVKRLEPITFDWKDGGMHDLGLGAEDVAAIEPLLVTYNDKGQVEGVKYDRIGVILINVIKEQQAQIDALKKLVCLSHKDAEICREK